jgi:hypothetical protein
MKTNFSCFINRHDRKAEINDKDRNIMVFLIWRVFKTDRLCLKRKSQIQGNESVDHSYVFFQKIEHKSVFFSQINSILIIFYQ